MQNETEQQTAILPREGWGHRLNFWFGKMQFGQSRRLEFYRKLHAMLKNNMPQALALKTIEDIASQRGKRPYDPEALMAQHVHAKTLEGTNLAEAMEGWVPHRDIMMLQTAEFATPLKPLASIIFVTRAMTKIRAALAEELIYPIALLFVAFTALVGVSTQIVPAFIEIAPNIVWQGMAGHFVNLTHHIALYWPLWLGGIIAATFIIALSMPYWTGQARTLFDKIPPWSIYRMWAGSGWLLSFAAMMSAGLTELDSLFRLEEKAPPWLKERNAAIRHEVANGRDIGDALTITGYDFPDFEINLLIAVYARLDSSGDALNRVAREWVENSEKRMRNIASTMRVLALFFTALVIAGSVGSIYAMEQQIIAALGVR